MNKKCNIKKEMRTKTTVKGNTQGETNPELPVLSCTISLREKFEETQKDQFSSERDLP